MQATLAVEITNPGFEDGWEGWSNGSAGGSGAAISDVANSGEKSLKLTEASAFVAQNVGVKPDTAYRLSVYVRGIGNIGVKVGADIFLSSSPGKAINGRN